MAYVGIGVVSGRSLDGLTLCCVAFKGNDDHDVWNHQILHAQTFPYSDEWTHRLQNASTCTGEELIQTHVDYGHLIGETVNEFISQNNLAGVQFVVSYGHPVFHKPIKGYTFALGEGETIASHLNAITITNLTSKDVALRGEGAAIYRVGERHLFGQYNQYLDLGGYCTFSCEEAAFTVAPCNLMLNYLSQKHDSHLRHDPNGEIAHAGSTIESLLDQLNNLKYYQRTAPKSLAHDWFESHVVPILNEAMKDHPTRDVMRTAVEHIADQVAKAIPQYTKDDSQEPVRLEKTLLVTGGGALNNALMASLRRRLQAINVDLTFIEPDSNTMKYKESTIVAFLGLRCLLNLCNIERSVTGSDRDTVSGSIHLPPGGVPINLLDTDQYAFSFRRRSSSASTAKSLQLPFDNVPPLPELPVERSPPAYHRASWPATTLRK